MRRRVTLKSNERRSDLFSGQTSKQYSSMGRHLVSTKCRKTSSDADLPSLPNLAVASAGVCCVLVCVRCVRCVGWKPRLSRYMPDGAAGGAWFSRSLAGVGDILSALLKIDPRGRETGTGRGASRQLDAEILLSEAANTGEGGEASAAWRYLAAAVNSRVVARSLYARLVLLATDRPTDRHASRNSAEALLPLIVCFSFCGLCVTAVKVLKRRLDADLLCNKSRKKLMYGKSTTGPLLMSE